MSLQGQVAVVTGGGRGIGAACAEHLAAEGARVAVCARSGAEVQAVAERIGGGAIALTCDVTDEEAVAAMAREVEKELGPASVLVNNAGHATSAPIARETLENWNRIFAVNATGTFLCTRALLPGMVERGAGRIINVASVSGLHGAPYVASYTAAKHAVIGLTRSLAAEVKASGVTVNAVCPGYVDTPMTEQSLANIMERTGRTREEALQAILASSSQARLISPQEVAREVVVLCRDAARRINGQAIVIDGSALLA